MPAILFALLAYVGFGAGDFLSAYVSKKIGSFSVAFWIDLLGAIFLTLLIPIFGKDTSNLTFLLTTLTILIGAFGTTGLIFLYEGLKKGNISVIVTIASSYPALVVLFSLFFYKETVTLPQLLAICVIIVGIILTGVDIHAIQKKDFTLQKGVGYALFAMFFWAIFFTASKIPTREMGWFWTTYFVYLPFIITRIYMKVRKIRLKKPKLFSKVTLVLCFSTLIGVIGLLSYYIGIESGAVAIVSPIAGSSSTLFVLLGYFFYKDKINKLQIVGIIAGLFGIVALSFLSV